MRSAKQENQALTIDAAIQANEEALVFQEAAQAIGQKQVGSQKRQVAQARDTLVGKKPGPPGGMEQDPTFSDGERSGAVLLAPSKKGT